MKKSVISLLQAALCVCLLCFAAAPHIYAEDQDGRVRLYIRATDPEGGKLAFTWMQLGGPKVTIADSVACKFEGGKWVSDTYFVPSEPGEYSFQVTVKNENGDETKKVFSRPVLAPAAGPVAVAGKDQEKKTGEVVRLNGLGSKAADGRTLANDGWEWRIVEAPEKFKQKFDLKNLRERAFEFKADEPGVYQFELRVSDDTKRQSEPSRVIVTVRTHSAKPELEASPPVAKVVLPGKVELAPAKSKADVVVQPVRPLKVGSIVVLDGSQTIVEDKNAKPDFFWVHKQGPFIATLAPDTSKPFSQDRTDTKNYPVWSCKPSEPGDYTFVLEVTVYGSNGVPEKIESKPVVFTVTADTPEVAPVKPPPVAVVEKPAVKVDPPPVKPDLPPVPVKPPEQVEIIKVKPDVPPIADVAPLPSKNGRPVARVAAERGEVEAGDWVVLDGSKSTDPDGDKLEFIWGPTDGKRYPTQWRGTKGPKVEFQAEEEGEYGVSLMVKDGKESSELAKVVILVGPTNQKPIVSLPKSIEGVVNEEIRIKGEARDPENDRMEFIWTCIDPKELKIPDSLAKNQELVFAPQKPGAYLFKFTATDAKGRGDSAQVMVGIKEAVNRSPVAIVDGPKEALAGTRVKLSGLRSHDPEGRPITYFWKQESGPSLPAVPGEYDKIWEFVPTEAGEYTLSLIVSDRVNKSEPDKFILRVSKKNSMPVAAIIAPPGGRLMLEETGTLDGSTSLDPDKDKLTFKWRIVDGGKGEVALSGADQEKASVVGKKVGPVLVELIVNDGTVDSTPLRIELTVIRSNGKPVAKITGPETARIKSFVDLSGAESSDPDGDELTYIWSQPIDGGPSIGVNAKELRKKTLRFSPERPGTYVIHLQVIDSELTKSDVAIKTIVVKGVNRPPQAIATRTGAGPVKSGDEIKLSAQSSLDPDGSPLTFRWKQIAGPPLIIADPESSVINVVAGGAGSYIFEVGVSDGDTTVPATVSFSVQAPNTPPNLVIADPISGEAGERAILDAGGTTDPDGDKIIEFLWSQVSGPKVSFARGTEKKAHVEVVLPNEGEYVFEVKAFDGKEWCEPRKVPVRTRAGNVAPTAAMIQLAVKTEEGVETVLDASSSNDPDNGPRPLSYIWKQLTGTPRVTLREEGPLAKFTPAKLGNYSFQLKVFDGKSESVPVEVRVEVLKAGSLPIAIADAPKTVQVANKAQKNNPASLLILDATRSHSKNGPLTYTWKQISVAAGDDLRLRPLDLAKDRIGILIYLPGTYRFSLTVSDGQFTSPPAYAEVKVLGDPALGVTPPAPAPAPAPSPKSPPSNGEPQSAKPESAPNADRLTQNSNPDGALLPPPGAQHSAMQTLATQGDPESERKLITALSSDDKDVRSAAAAALYSRGINSIPALIGVLENGSLRAKEEAQWALKELTHEPYGPNAKEWKQWWSRQPGSKLDAQAQAKN